MYSYLYTCGAPFGADRLINKINLFNSTGVTKSYIAKTSARSLSLRQLPSHGFYGLKDLRQVYRHIFIDLVQT